MKVFSAVAYLYHGQKSAKPTQSLFGYESSLAMLNGEWDWPKT